MNINDFIKFINEKTSMCLELADIDKELSTIEGWDSLTFVYMIIELEKEGNINFNVEALLSCRSLRNIHEQMKYEIVQN